MDNPGLADLRNVWAKDKPVAALVFYRALVQADNVAPVRALVEALADNGVNCLPVYCTSLKDPVSAGVIESLLAECEAGMVLNGTGFAVSTPGKPTVDSPLNATGAPVLQVVFSGGNEKDWRAGTRGLSARDIAMNVALPEVDGRILSRAVSFKGEARFDESTQCSLVAYEPVADRIEFVARLAASWLRLGRTPVEQRRLAVILANYPNRDGRLGNGVGLDTPASVVELLRSLEGAGYGVADIPRDGDGLIERLRRGPTNAALDGREISVTLTLRAYCEFFDSLPAPVRQLVIDRWGEPQRDPFYLAASDEFALSAFHCGNVVIGLQPARTRSTDGFFVAPMQHGRGVDARHHVYRSFVRTISCLTRLLTCTKVVENGARGDWVDAKTRGYRPTDRRRSADVGIGRRNRLRGAQGGCRREARFHCLGGP